MTQRACHQCDEITYADGLCRAHWYAQQAKDHAGWAAEMGRDAERARANAVMYREKALAACPTDEVRQALAAELEHTR